METELDFILRSLIGLNMCRERMKSGEVLLEGKSVLE